MDLGVYRSPWNGAPGAVDWRLQRSDRDANRPEQSGHCRKPEGKGSRKLYGNLGLWDDSPTPQWRRQLDTSSHGGTIFSNRLCLALPSTRNLTDGNSQRPLGLAKTTIPARNSHHCGLSSQTTPTTASPTTTVSFPTTSSTSSANTRVVEIILIEQLESTSNSYSCCYRSQCHQ